MKKNIKKKPLDHERDFGTIANVAVIFALLEDTPKLKIEYRRNVKRIVDKYMEIHYKKMQSMKKPKKTIPRKA